MKFQKPELSLHYLHRYFCHHSMGVEKVGEEGRGGGGVGRGQGLCYDNIITC